MKERFPGHKKVLNGIAAGAMIFGATSCDANTNPIPESTNHPPAATETATPKPSQSTGTPRPETNSFPIAQVNSKGEFLNFPFPANADVKIQQGWTSNFEPNHHAIDYISGEVNHSETWKRFQVVAASAGLVCANPPDRLGNAVLEEFHLSDGRKGFIYYGHLSEIEKDIPNCSTSERKKVSNTDAIGISGDTGTEPGWIHLHFSVNMGNKPIDPYGLELADINSYPDSKFTNGKSCGPVNLFIACSEKSAGLKTSSPSPDKTKSGLTVHLKYADGKPVPSYLLSLFKQPDNINNFLGLANQVGLGPTDEKGTENFDAPAGKYILLFDQIFLPRIYGSRINKSTKDPGIADIQISPNEKTDKIINLGRINFRINDSAKNPVQKFWGKDDHINAEFCVNEVPTNYQIVCNTLDEKTGTTINLLPGNFFLTYSWYDAKHGWQDYKADIGDKQIKPGVTMQIDCPVYSPDKPITNQTTQCTIFESGK